MTGSKESTNFFYCFGSGRSHQVVANKRSGRKQAEENISDLLEKAESFKIFRRRMMQNGFSQSIEQCHIKVKKLHQQFIKKYTLHSKKWQLCCFKRQIY